MAADRYCVNVGSLAGLLGAVTMAGTAAAQGLRSTVDVRHVRPDGAASFVTGVDGRPVAVTLPPGQGRATPMDFLREHGTLFGVTDPERQLALVRSRTDSIGHAHTTYRQVHNGVRVFSGVVKVHQDQAGNVVAANGDFYRIPSRLENTPTLTADEAVQRASDANGDESPRGLPIDRDSIAPAARGGLSVELTRARRASESKEPVNPRGLNAERQAAELNKSGQSRGLKPAAQGTLSVERSELVIVDPGWYGDPAIGAHLAYYVILADASRGMREAFFVDAHTGEILDQWTLMCNVLYRSIHDAAETQALPGPLARLEGDPPIGLFDADAAYDYLGDVHKYFLHGFGRDSIDGRSYPLIATVRSTILFCPNASWNGEQMILCSGMVADDIVAHELMHGITEQTADLIYQNQPGQLNESYSDVFGELIDLFNGNAAFVGAPGGTPWPTHPTGPGVDVPNDRRGSNCGDSVRWLVSEDARALGGAIRDMWNPPCFDHPDRANSPLQTCPAWDYGGVHMGSGIPNHAFAMLTDGKTFNGHTVTAIGPIKAAAVWYRALTTYLTPASDFQDAFYSFLQAASDLVGTSPLDPRTSAPSSRVFTAADAAAVREALLAVEMDTDGLCGVGERVLEPGDAFRCPFRTTIFTYDFENGASGWTFFNSSPPTPYDWTLTTTTLPTGETSRVWFCEDRDVGDCVNQDESAVHSLRSPVIALPEDADYPMLSFAHFLRAEGSWDGGNVKISVNGGPWELIPRTAFEHNPYNARLNSEDPQGNTNPLSGEPAWSGFGGQWGVSVADLSGLVNSGDTMELQFDFGKNGCVGVTGWFIDDVEVFTCPDCNADGTPDVKGHRFTFASSVLANMGEGASHLIRIPTPPFAGSDVTLSLTAVGDFSSAFEAIVVRLNFLSLGWAFQYGAGDCPLTPDRDTLTIDAGTYNALLAAVPDHSAWIEFEAGGGADAELCGGESFLTVFVKYHLTPPPAAEPDGTAKNRYLSFVPGYARGEAALQVTLVDLPPPFEDYNGETRWVGEPVDISELPGVAGDAVPVFTGARLGCEPFVTTWRNVGLLHVFGEEIVPGATYEVRAVDATCGVVGNETDAPPLIISTGVWGDVAAPFAGEGGTQPDILDPTAILDKFKYLPGAPVKPRVDLHPSLPDRVIHILDVMSALDAFKGTGYPFAGPRPCP